MSGVLGRRHPTDTPSRIAVRYTACSKGDHTDEDEVEEIAVVTQAEEEANTSGGSRTQSQDELLNPRDRDMPSPPAAGPTKVAVNGPRTLPPSGPFQSPSDRTRLIGQRLSSVGRISLSSPAYSNRLIEQKSRTTSRGSLFEMVTNKLEQVRDGRKSKQLNPNEMGYINKAHTLDPMTPRQIRKQRRKDIQEKFGKKARFERLETSTSSSEKDTCKWTFVFDPAGRLAYWWSFVVSIAFLYNFWVIIYRFAFEEINASNMAVWFTLDYFADLVYILDIAFHFRTGFLEDGVLQTDGVKLRLHYMNTTMFYIDCLCLLPLDFLYLSIGFKSMLRCFRLVKIYRFWAFLDRTERHTNYPNVVRTITLLHYLFAVYHWNACLMYLVTKHISNAKWLYPKEDTDVFTRYLQSLYWSTLTLTTIGDLPKPETKGEYIFVIVEFVFGLLLFATILGHIANIVTCISAARKDFQARLDCVKTYMSLRRVPLKLQDKVIKWFDYLWLSKKSSDEEKTMALLPDKLKGEIALHVHLDTLKRVEIFQNTEAGFLRELVLLYRPVLFSPGDYICRKGEVGKEMYIVNRGRLQVVADNGKTVLATLRPGSYFGEISILNMGNAGNRRTASVRSVGYSDLFCLSKKDLWEVLKDYPTARVRLEAIAVKRLEKYKKQPLEKEGPVVLPRSKSTPGLVESRGKVPLQSMQLYSSRHNTLPSSVVASQRSSATSRSRSRSSSLRTDHEENCSTRSHRSTGTGGVNDPDPDPDPETDMKAAASADMTNSMTVSSITSYITESSAQRSPVTVEQSKAASPPPSPRLPAPPSAPPPPPPPPTNVVTTAIRVIPAQNGPAGSPLNSFVPVQGAMPYGASPVPVMDVLDQHPSPTRQISPYPPYNQPVVPPSSPFSSAYMCQPPVVCTTSPAHLTAGASQLPHIPISHSMYGFGRASPVLTASGSVTSLSREPPSDILLQEITRLRERLHSMENENAALSHKLSQQQWDVEQRLSEIEMHICGSDSVGSGSDEKSTVGNKESVI